MSRASTSAAAKAARGPPWPTRRGSPASRARSEQPSGGSTGWANPAAPPRPGGPPGPGLGLALAADLRIGCPRTVLATAFAGVGLSGDYGVAWLLSALVGPALARQPMFLGGEVDKA